MEKLFLPYGEIERIRQKYPGKLPIFVTRAQNANDVPNIPKNKFLVPASLSVGQFIYIIRGQIKLPPEKALFIFINNTIPSASSLISEVYKAYKSTDGALRITYTSENTFGL
jgi:GABA(A) receptor-associated protein